MTDAGAQALFNAAVAAGSPYSGGDQFVINNAFVSLRSSGWLARLDRLCFPAAGTQVQGLIDWITLQTYSITGSMSFAPYLGLTGDGSTGCIDTGLSPSAATHFTLNNAMYGVAISSTRTTGAVMCAMGTAGDSDGECRIYPFYTGNQSFTSINHQFSTSTLAPPNVHGIYMENRPDATHMVYYQNTGVLRNDGVTATSLDTNTFKISASAVGGVPSDFSTDTNAGFWIGQGASGDADEAVLEGIIATFLSQIGVTAAPVVANIGGGFQHLGRHTRDELFPEEEAVTEATTEALPVKPPSRKMRKRIAAAAKQPPAPPVDDEEEEAMMIGLAA